MKYMVCDAAEAEQFRREYAAKVAEREESDYQIVEAAEYDANDDRCPNCQTSDPLGTCWEGCCRECQAYLWRLDNGSITDDEPSK